MENNVVKGYKVFNHDWTCRPNGNLKQYTCPGKFEEDIIPIPYKYGMHFYKKAVNCFNYYHFNTEKKVAEVIAYGTVVEDGAICCTDKLEIVREISWVELLKIVNTGMDCTGIYNSGSWNSGNCNSGNRNNGHNNSGNWNRGDYNSGHHNDGNWNSGDYNGGHHNNGNRNSGNWNSGDYNSGDRNNGHNNSGNWNSGDYNSGHHNSGNWNSGNWNSGNYNSGNQNSGDWNKTNFSNGCFNTVEPKIYLFNKLSNWTYSDWQNSVAYYLLSQMPNYIFEYVCIKNMTDEEKAKHPEAEIRGGYLKPYNHTKDRIDWWKKLSENEKSIIMAIPNFDKEIFKEITGIDVDK